MDSAPVFIVQWARGRHRTMMVPSNPLRAMSAPFTPTTDSASSPPVAPGAAERIWAQHFHDPEASASQARALLAASDAEQRPNVHGWCALTIGYYYLFYSADPAKAGPWLDQATAAFAASDERRGTLMSTIGLSRLRLTLGDALGARATLVALQDEARRLPPQDCFYAINALAATFFYTDELDQTIRHLYAALEVLRGLGVTPQLPTLLSNLAAVLVTLGDYEPARDLAQEALALTPRFNNPQLVLFARSNLAEALHGVGDRDGALKIVEAMLR